MTNEVEIGTYVDLRYLNKKREVPVVVARKSSLKQTVENWQEVGTQYIFDQAQKKLARRIPVVFA